MKGIKNYFFNWLSFGEEIRNYVWLMLFGCIAFEFFYLFMIKAEGLYMPMFMIAAFGIMQSIFRVFSKYVYHKLSYNTLFTILSVLTTINLLAVFYFIILDKNIFIGILCDTILLAMAGVILGQIHVKNIDYAVYKYNIKPGVLENDIDVMKNMVYVVATTITTVISFDLSTLQLENLNKVKELTENDYLIIYIGFTLFTIFHILRCLYQYRYASKISDSLTEYYKTK